MLDCFGANLHEILEVRGSALKEYELWALLRVISAELDDLTFVNDCNLSQPGCFISPERIILLPNGRIHFPSESRNESEVSNTLLTHIRENKQWKTKTFQVYSFGLTILWCADYGLKQTEMIVWSNELQQLVTSMCDETNVVDLQEVVTRSHEHKSANSTNDVNTVVELCESIVGNVCELDSFDEHSDLNESLPERIQDFHEKVSSSEEKVQSHSRKHTSSTSSMERNAGKQTVPTTRPSALKPFQDKTNRPSLKPPPDKLPAKMKVHKSILNNCGRVKHLEIGASSFTNVQLSFLVIFPDRSQASITCGQVGMVQILRCALDSWLYSINQQYFALAYWEESEYNFFQTFAELQAKLKNSDGNQVFYLRILYFPPNTNNIDANMLKAMYLQLRTDLLDERITCLYDDALSTAALALQHEIKDYKPVYKNEYFNLAEFVPAHVTSQLGAAHVRQQVTKLHRQLAGIGHQEALILFLRRCSNFEEYGVNFHKTFRLKSCKNENSTWLGVGPRGISVFDLRNNNSRMKRHFLNWADLKKMNCKNRKLSFSVMNPAMKLKFYQKVQERANYLLTVIGKLHQFYRSQKPSRNISSLGLFDDITKLSPSANPSPSRSISMDQPVEPPRTPLQACFTSSSIDPYKPNKGKAPKTPTVASSSSSSLEPSVGKPAEPLRKPSLNSHSSTSGGSTPEGHAGQSSVTEPKSTTGHFVRSFRTIRKPSSASSSSSSTRRRFKLVATSTPVLSDAKSSWSVPSDEYISPVTRTTKRKVTITRAESGSFIDQNVPGRLEESKLDDLNESIHKTARDYYRTSLSSSTDASNHSASLNGSIPSASGVKCEEASPEHIYDNVADDPPPSSHSDSFSSNCITFYHSDSSNL